MASNQNSPFNKKDQIKVFVVNGKGEVTTVECTTRLSVDRIKLSALTNFIGDQVVAFKTIDQYRIVSIQKKRILSCETPICVEEIASGETLFLLKNCPIQGEPETGCGDPLSSLKGPSISSIIEATRCIAPKNHQFHVQVHDVDEQFDQDMRPMFVALVDYALKLLQFHPEVEPILKDMKPLNTEEPEREGTNRKRKNVSTGNDNDEHLDVDSLKQLTDLKFSSDQSKRALRMSNMSPTEALDFLMESQSDSTSNCQPTTSSTRISPLTIQIYPKIPALIDCVNKYNRRNFVPTESVFNNLKQLGFEDDEILDAMWRFKNNQELATEWLIALHRPKLADLCRGLTYDDPFIKEIVNTPEILSILIKPRTFFALISLIEAEDICEVSIANFGLTFFVEELYRVYHLIHNHGADISESQDDHR